MFCLKCGEKSDIFVGVPNPNTTKNFIMSCKNKHQVLTNEKEHTCPEGMQHIRTIALNGFQTSHIPNHWNPESFKDKHFHSVNLLAKSSWNMKL